MNSASKTLENTIDQIMREASLIKLKDFARLENAKIVEIDANLSLGQVLSDQMILMAISGEDLRITVKLHYKRGQTAKLLQNEVGEINEMQSNLIDYMKELSNQICGKICRIFAKQKISLGMSIPIRLRGFYEAYSDYRSEQTPLQKFGDGWKIVDEFGEIFITTYVEISSVSRLRNLTCDISESNDQGMEFL